MYLCLYLYLYLTGVYTGNRNESVNTADSIPLYLVAGSQERNQSSSEPEPVSTGALSAPERTGQNMLLLASESEVEGLPIFSIKSLLGACLASSRY